MSGIYSEAMTPDGSSLVVKDAERRDRRDRAASIPRTTPGWSRRRPTPLGNGDVHGRVHGDLRPMATPSARPGRSRSPSRRRPSRPRSPRPPRRDRAPSAAPTAGAGDSRPLGRPDPGAIGRRQRHGERQRRPPADHRRPDRPRRRGRLPAEPTQPPARRRRDRRDPARGRAWRPGSRRRRAAIGLALGLAVFLPATVAAHTLNATYTSRLPLAVYLVGAAATVALSFVFVIVRDVRAAPPDLDADGLAAAGLAPLRAPRHRPRRLGLDHRPGDRRRTRATATSRRSSCGSTAGSGWRSSARSSARSGTSSTRSRRSTTSAPRSCAGSGSQGWAVADYPARLGRWPADDRVRVLRLARARDLRRRRRRCSSCSSATRRSRWR